ncbi:hypothetical protein D7V93_37515, partial [Corallococcus llansteffanensis]
TGAGRVALTTEGDVLTHVTWWSEADPDAGTVREPLRSRLVLLSADAGVLLAASAEEDGGGVARLAVDDARGAYLYTPWDGRLAFTSWMAASVDAGSGMDGGGAMRVGLASGPGFGPTALADGGVASLLLEPLGPGVPGGAPSLALASGRLLAGARAFVDTDGGVPVALDWDGGARTLSPLAEPVLLTPGGSVGHAFALVCDRTDGTACPVDELRTVLRSFSFDDGHVLYEVDVLPTPVLPGTFHEAALLERGALGVLADAQLPNGEQQAWLEWFASGQKVDMCPLPGRVQVAGAVFSGEVMHVVLRRDGVWLLESYAVGQRTEARGWPQRHAGPSGARRAVP